MGKAKAKIERMRKALAHQEGDRVPVGEFFWSGFVMRCQDRWGESFDPYREFDLDYVVINPNMDPHIQEFQVLEESGDDVVVKTGFGATIRRCGTAPMPIFEGFSVDQPDKMKDFHFDDPTDPRRFTEGGDDQINCVGDVLARRIPSWIERMEPYLDDFAVFGSVCEPYEFLWRVVGTENALIWMAWEEKKIAAFIDRIGEFLLELARSEIEAANGKLSGMYIWGDVAYHHGMFFGATRWREMFKPHVEALIDLCRENNLMTIYHGCGNAIDIFGDLADLGLDAYNPLEAKAGLDVVELKKEYAKRLAFVGNIDVRVLEEGNREAIEREVRHKLQAAKGGGYVFQSDHSISSHVEPEDYMFALEKFRELNTYPLRL